MPPAQITAPPAGKVSEALKNFVRWLDRYGESSWDHQSFFAGPFGRRAKQLYYHHQLLGTAAVAPMILCEALFPPARRLFHHRMRLPIADAHYAMGFAFLHEATGRAEYLEKAVHFLEVLKQTRSPGFANYCWGYPFDWVTRNGVLKQHTPFITTTPYVFEALLQVQQLAPRPEWKDMMASTVRYATEDIRDRPFPGGGNTCSYLPGQEFDVVNASSYRAAMLAGAATFFGRDEWLKIAAANVDFVLAAQNPDGSWPYAKDGVRDFVDHFHTCFVMKGLAKTYQAGRDRRIFVALTRGIDFYLAHLFSADGLPRPFAKAPRLTVYRCELYDCAECINLCLLLRHDFPQLEATLQTVVARILDQWIKPDGSFRSRKLRFGWDNVPMHRWAQSQMFRALAFYLRENNRRTQPDYVRNLRTN
ncbi:MAG: hypothetical protein ABSH48_00465 [Verrucomicrobiota bacterium]|jgi:hypothetical protein